MKIILVSGYIGSGKTTFLNYLKDKLNSLGYYTEKFSFADKVKEIAKKDFLWDGKKDKKGRRLLQVIGTEAGREYNEDIWAVHLKNKLDSLPVKPSVVIIDDWRFPNEYEILSAYYEVYPIRILGKPSTSDHISEHALDNFNHYVMMIVNTFRGVEEEFSAPAESLVDNVLGMDYWKTLDKPGK